MDFSNQTDRFNKESPIPCYKLKIISGYCVIVFILCLVFNSLLLRVFLLYKYLRTSINHIIIVLTLVNLLGSIIEMSFVILSNYNCRLIFYSIMFIKCFNWISGRTVYLARESSRNFEMNIPTWICLRLIVRHLKKFY